MDDKTLQRSKCATGDRSSAGEVGPSGENHEDLSGPRLFRFCLGFLLFGVVWGIGIGMVSNVLLPQHCEVIAGSRSTTLLGYINAFASVSSLVSNLLFGILSDRSRCRFGKRGPFVLLGGFFGGFSLFSLHSITNPLLLIVDYGLCMAGLNCMLAPMTASVADRIPFPQRGTVSAFYAAGGTIGGSLGSVFGAHFASQQQLGFTLASVLMFLGGVTAVVILPREQSTREVFDNQRSWREIAKSLRPPVLAENRNFYNAFVGRFLFLISYEMIFVYHFYILENYIGLRTQNALYAISTIGIFSMTATLLGSLVAGLLSDLLRMRRQLVIISTVCFAVGVAIPWLTHSVAGMYWYAAVAGVGYGVYTAVDQALLIDVLPDSANAGKDLGFLNFATTGGQMGGSLVMPMVVVAWGYGLAFPISIVLALASCVFVFRVRTEGR